MLLKSTARAKSHPGISYFLRGRDKHPGDSVTFVDFHKQKA